MTKSGLGTVNTNPEAQRAGQSSSGSNATATPNRRGGRQDDLHIAPNRYQVQNNDVMRIPPGERGYCPYDRPGKFWGPNPHYFGYHVEVLPPRPHHFVHWGVDYYMHNDIYYRRHGAHYIVCRPPFGVVLSHTLRDLHLASVRFAYYTNVYRTYGLVNDNWRTIDQQNRIIAQNNAIIAAQNRSIAMNITAAGQSYSIANTLGLVQSYAYADKEYYYEDGVFYIINNSGYYQVIVPPAGALVDSLPDDYDIISFGGVEYYKVDDTVYRLVLIQGTPLLEVLGQSYR